MSATPTTTTKDLPYLDGFVGIFADKQVGARGGDPRPTGPRPNSAACRPRRSISSRRNLATRSPCRQSDWNCGNLITPNSKRKPFDDVRVRNALLLAIDQWHGAPALSKIANVHTVGGVVFPGSPLAANKEELQKLAGFWPDIDKSRAEAKRLLKEAGHENLSFELLNRNVDQPYKYVGTWIVDEWSKIGVKATQRVVPTGPWFEAMRGGNFDVVVEANCNGVVNPVMDTQKYLPKKAFVENYGGYEDQELIDIYEKMLHETDAAKQRVLMRQYENPGGRHHGLRVSDAVVEPHPARAVVYARLEDRPEPLREPGPGEHLAGEVRGVPTVIAGRLGYYSRVTRKAWNR